MRRRTAFVEQDDILWDKLTVFQTLLFTARLRLNWNRKKLESRVEDVIQILRLTKCRETKVGVCSGGQKRRVCIAKELLNEPRIMLLDEITSGLDSTMALVVVETVREVARRDNLVVIISIHQPNSHIFRLMDNLLLMATDGMLLYQGPANDAAEYFGSMGYPCPANYNPPDFFMNMLVLEKIDKSTKEKMVLKSRTRAGISAEGINEEVDASAVVSETRSERYHHSWFKQVRILLERDWIISTDKFITKTTCALNIGNFLIKVGLYWQIGYEEADVLTHFAALLWIFGIWVFFCTMDSVPVLHTVHDQVEKELQVGAYRLSAFFSAKSIVHIVLNMFWPTILVPIEFFCIFKPEMYEAHPYKIFLVWLLLLLTIFMIQGIGLVISASFTMERGIVIGILVLTFFFGMSGFFNEVESWLSWLLWANAFIPTLTMGAAVFWIGNTWICDTPSDFRDCPEHRISKRDAMDKFFPMYDWSSALLYMIVAAVLFRLIGYKLWRIRMSKNIGK